MIWIIVCFVVIFACLMYLVGGNGKRWWPKQEPKRFGQADWQRPGGPTEQPER